MAQYIGLVRHGITDWNAQGKIQGRTDIPLNDTGRKQAALLAERLKKEDIAFEAVISSGLRRADETGAILANALNIPLLEPEPGLVERAYGQVEGTTPEEREKRWGVDWRQLDLGQERDDELRDRAVKTLESLALRREGANLLAVTHGSWLAQLFIALFGQMSQGHIGNLSYSILERRGAEWHPVLYNCTKHIQPSDAVTIHRGR
ncbi:histidine phosphatase family protein [Paenibacillus dendritiformis]|uniref:histidine phosphatase family protein n=1 Tax=Paenibacillus dendritiformis TaxID=130049 RepID=UPI00248C3129|nr:histidine phosphatase family protein [Paenibacillus dendritiformis]WGU95493.1 histidine phosphatase family protein [Paenibacillus dendritiformis]